LGEVVSMREISQDEYMRAVEVPIENAIEDALFNVLTGLSLAYGFYIPLEPEKKYPQSVQNRRFEFFHSYYMDGFFGEFREKAIELFELVGMDIRPENEER